MRVPVKPPFSGFETVYDRAKVCILGVPLDLTSTHRPGCRFGPQKIREASLNLETYVPSADADVCENPNFADLGDLLLPPDLEEAGKILENEVRTLQENGKIPVLLGGEHTLTYFSCRVLEPDFILYLDAHADLREEWVGRKLCHCTVVKRILDHFPATNLALIGTRSYSKEEAELIARLNLKVHRDEAFSDPVQFARRLAEKISGRVYLSLDIDILDPAFAPGVSCPEPGGISTKQLLEFIRGLKGLEFCGVDLVEVCPPFDNDCTSFAAARALYEILAHLL